MRNMQTRTILRHLKALARHLEDNDFTTDAQDRAVRAAIAMLDPAAVKRGHEKLVAGAGYRPHPTLSGWLTPTSPQDLVTLEQAYLRVTNPLSDPSKLATVLAALRHFQLTFENCPREELPETFPHFEDCMPLTMDAIDDLCEELNRG